MAFFDIATDFKAACKDVNETHKLLSVNTTNVIDIGEANTTEAAALETAGKNVMTAADQSVRSSLRRVMLQKARKLIAVCAYGATQLATPSKYVRNGWPTNLELMWRDIVADLVAGSDYIDPRAVTAAAEPAADDDGIIDRLTIDENGEPLEGGRHGSNILAIVQSQPRRYASVLRFQASNPAADVFDMANAVGFLDVPAINNVQTDGLVTNPKLASGINSTTAGDAVTALSGWTLSTSGGAPTHIVDTTNLYRDLSLSHRIYGSGGQSRIFAQPLIVRDGDRYTPQNDLIIVWKQGSPTGNITITRGGVSQTWTMAGLSAGYNYLRLDRDRDCYPSKFASSGGTRGFTVECTTGSASNYVSILFFDAQRYRNWNGFWHGHWSRNGESILFVQKAIADSQTAGGLNATAVAVAMAAYGALRLGYLPTSGATNIADYT